MNTTDHTVPDSSPLINGQPHATATVQNKVATGTTLLSEDTSPLYLSSRPVSRCAKLGCALAGTTMWSAATVTVTCHIHGETMTNADLSSSGIQRNPHADTSDLWYLIIWPDGRRGYLSEVYLTPDARGGLNLPAC